MSTARDVIAQTLAQMRPGDPDTADVVLAALQEHWISDEVQERLAAAVDSPIILARVRAVTAVLVEEWSR